MVGKKHPLEIYKRHQGFFNKPSKRASSPARTKPAGNRDSRGARGGRVQYGSADRKATGRAAAPGDRKITLSMNNVLIILIVIVTGFIGSYFLGYHKSRKIAGGIEESELKGSRLLLDAPREEETVQSVRNEEISTSNVPEARQAYTIQVATYARKQAETARNTNEWLVEQGFDSKLFPVANENQYIIMVGSFSDKEDPELQKLLHRIRSIDNFRYGKSAPFRDARIRQYKVE